MKINLLCPLFLFALVLTAPAQFSTNTISGISAPTNSFAHTNTIGGTTNSAFNPTNTPGSLTLNAAFGTNNISGTTNVCTDTNPVVPIGVVLIYAGTNTPNGWLTAGTGSIYNQFDAGTNFVQQWVKWTRSLNTGWVAVSGGGGITSVVGGNTNDFSGGTLTINTNYLTAESEPAYNANSFATGMNQSVNSGATVNFAGVTIGGGAAPVLTDAPNDGGTYARSNNTWVEIALPPSIVISIDGSGTMTWVASGVTATQFNVYETYDQDVNNMSYWSLVGTGNFSDGSYGGLQTNDRWYILTPIDGSSNPIQPFSNQFHSSVL